MTLRVTPAEIVAKADAIGHPGLLAKAPDWSRVRLGEVARVVNGAAYKSSHFNVDGHGRPLIRIRDVGADKPSTWYDGPWEKTHLVERNDILVGMDGDFRAARWRSEDGLLNQRVCRIDVDSALYDDRFLLLALQGYLDAIWAATSSTTVKHLSSRSVADIPLPRPDLDEQRRIVDILEDHLSRLDAAETGCGASELRLKALRQSMWMRSFRPEAVLDQNPLVPLLDVVTIANGQTPKGLGDLLTQECGADSVPFFKVGDMNLSDGRYMDASRSFIARDHARSLRLHLRPPGTVLIPKRGGAIATNKKRILRSEAAYDLNTMGLQSSDRILSEYLWNWLEGIDLAKLGDGSNVPQINAPQIRGLALPLPDLSIQAAIVNRLDSSHQQVEQLKSGLSDVRRRAQLLRSALLTAAFRGRLTGRSSDMDLVEEMAEA